MEYRYLKTESLAEGVEMVTISAPETLNALSRNILEELGHYVDSISPEVKVWVITGAGKAFVAGADIAQMSVFDSQQAFDFSVFGADVFARIEQLPIPVIAAVNGFALGGGCELAMACDIRIASVKARFGQPEVKLGIIPGFSGTYRLPKLIGQGMAKEMIYSGKIYDADDALRVGLVNRVVAPEELIPVVTELAVCIAANAPVALRQAKRSINSNYGMEPKEAIAFENTLFSECFDTLDQKTGMQAFLEKKKPEFQNK